MLSISEQHQSGYQVKKTEMDRVCSTCAEEDCDLTLCPQLVKIG